MKTTGLGDKEKQLEFLAMLADGAKLEMNGIPWRDAYVKFVAIVECRPEEEIRREHWRFLASSPQKEKVDA